jgi:ketosteroid isomerase-like protein
MRNRSFAILLLVGLGVIFTSCQKPVETGLSAEDEAAIRAVVDKAQAIDQSTEEGLTSYVKTYYAADVTVMPPNQPAVTGHDAIISVFKEMPPYEDFLAEILSIDGRDGLAYVRGRYSFNMQMPGVETPVHDTGKYIEIWRKQADGGWKVYLDIFNSDVPLPAPETEPIK